MEFQGYRVDAVHRTVTSPGGQMSRIEPKAFDLLEPEIAKLMPTYPDNEKVSHIVNFDWWADNLPAMQRRFHQWLQS